jgi:hypothetical protein
MIKKIIAVVAGYVVWSIGWVGIIGIMRKGGLLAADETQPISQLSALLSLLILSIILSIIAGFITSAMSASRSTIIWLGVLLLATGIFVQSQRWTLMPMWYHIAFLALLIPLSFVGAWLQRSSAS